jgi:hypothetical protein
MIESKVEKRPSPHGGKEFHIECNGVVVGSVLPYGDPPTDGKTRKKWKAIVNGVLHGIYTGQQGRIIAIRSVKHLSKHLRMDIQADADLDR